MSMARTNFGMRITFYIDGSPLSENMDKHVLLIWMDANKSMEYLGREVVVVRVGSSTPKKRGELVSNKGFLEVVELLT